MRTQQRGAVEVDPRSAKARLFGDDSSDRLRKQMIKARFLDNLPEPTGGGATREQSEGATEPIADELAVEPVRVGRFVILDKLGQGGMGVVYAAYDERLDRKIALKLLRSELSKDERGRARMQREAQALARLSHPNVVVIHEVGEWREHEYVAMEFVEGETLRDWLEQRERSWQEILPVVIRAGRGLAAAHSAELVHRDFKPANVIVGKDGRPRVLDFGLARAAGEGSGSRYRVGDVLETEERTQVEPVEFAETNEGASSEFGGRTTAGTSAFDKMLTVTGAVLGTPAYMAPEQHLGERATPLSDQFSFCLVLYEALFGRRPYEARTRNEYAVRVTEGDFIVPGPDSGVPAWLRQAVCRGLAPKPGDRWPSMDALLAELERDRDRFWKRALVGGGLVASFGLALAIGGRGPDSAPLCQLDASSITDSWGSSQRDQVRAAFGGVELAGVARVLEQTEAELDDYAGALVSARRSACEQRQLEASLTDAQYELRTACLEQREAELAAVVELLVDANEDVVLRASELLGELGDVEMCARVDLLERGVPVPRDEVALAAIAEARKDIARANAAREVGRQLEAVSIASSLRERAALLDYLPLTGEVALLEGRNARSARALGDASDALIEAVRIAELADHAELGAAAWLELGVVASQSEREPKLELALAEAGVERLGSRPADRFTLHTVRATSLALAGQHAAALAQYDRAVELAEAGFPGHASSLVNALVLRSGVLSELGRAQEARAALERALAVEGLSAEHPQILAASFDLAILELDAGELDAAARRFEAVIADFERIHGPRYSMIGHGHLALAQIELARSRFEEAERHIALALEVLDAEHEDHGWVLDAKAGLEIERGQHDRAAETLERALEHSLRVAPADTIHAAYLRGRLAAQLVSLGREDAALLELDRAIAELDADPAPLALVQPLVDRGRILAGLGDLDGALESLSRARDIASVDCGQPALAATARLALAEVEREHDRGDRGVGLAREAMSLLEGVEGASDLQAHAQLLLKP